MENTTKKTLEILVVEDNPKHIKQARKDLASQGNLTIVSTYKDAINHLGGSSCLAASKLEIKVPENYRPDVVITDERIPYAKEAIYPVSESFTGKPQPLGSRVVLYAIAKKISCVALVSDTNHHADENAATIDDFSRICDETIMMGNTTYFEDHYNCQNGKKMYGRILEALLNKGTGFAESSSGAK